MACFSIFGVENDSVANKLTVKFFVIVFNFVLIVQFTDFTIHISHLKKFGWIMKSLDFTSIWLLSLDQTRQTKMRTLFVLLDMGTPTAMWGCGQAAALKVKWTQFTERTGVPWLNWRLCRRRPGRPTISAGPTKSGHAVDYSNLDL